jgi:diacylglycerol kinase family enzyme
MSANASPEDGKFELSAVRGKSVWRLFKHLFKATVKADDETPQVRSYNCVAIRNMHIQLDGEIYTILSGETLEVKCERRRLPTII